MHVESADQFAVAPLADAVMPADFHTQRPRAKASRGTGATQGLVHLGRGAGGALRLRTETVYDGLQLLQHGLAAAAPPLGPDLVPLMLAACLLAAARLMQGAMVGDPALAAGEDSLVDPTQLHYLGVSLGSVLGGAQVAMSPDIDRAVMQISGMSFSTILTRSSAFSSFLLLLGAKYDDAADAFTIHRSEVRDGLSLAYVREGIGGYPLLLVHGLADDNVVAAHTLQLSSALLAAGCAHEVLPLSGVTHMTPQEVVAENLLLHQLGFLRRTLD